MERTGRAGSTASRATERSIATDPGGCAGSSRPVPHPASNEPVTNAVLIRLPRRIAVNVTRQDRRASSSSSPGARELTVLLQVTDRPAQHDLVATRARGALDVTREVEVRIRHLRVERQTLLVRLDRFGDSAAVLERHTHVEPVQ